MNCVNELEVSQEFHACFFSQQKRSTTDHLTPLLVNVFLDFTSIRYSFYIYMKKGGETNLMKTLLSTSLAGVSFFALAIFSPVSAASVGILGNGAFSDNAVRVNETNTTVIRQVNNTDIRNNVLINNDTGHNSANYNTGGDVAIQTGDANANVSIKNEGGLNVANVSGNQSNGDTSIKVLGNGAFSDNLVNYSERNTTVVDQNNMTNIDNNVNVHNNTGHNTASGNTSSNWNPWYWGNNNNGDVSIQTGNADANVSITNKAGLNEANVSGNNSHGDTHVVIGGNGAYSDNAVRVNDNNANRVLQNNDTHFNNDVNVHNNTGYNNAGSEGYRNFLPKYEYPSYPVKDDHNNYQKMMDYRPSFMLPDWNKHNQKEYGKEYQKQPMMHDVYYKEYPKYDGAYAKQHEYFPVMSYKNNYNDDRGYKNHEDNYNRNYPSYVTDYHKDYQSNSSCGKTPVLPVLFTYVRPVFYRPVTFPIVYVPQYKNYGFDKDDHHYTKKNNDEKKYARKDYSPIAYHPFNFLPKFYGNTGGNVSIHTGDAYGTVKLQNLASANYLR